VQAFGHSLMESREVEAFVELVRPLGDRISLGMTLLRATAPGVPDVYEGDELELLALVDPDNRRPVDWEVRRRALADPPPKLRVLREALALRARRPDAFVHDYEPVEAGEGVCAYRRGDSVLVAVPIREGRNVRPTARLARPPPGPPGPPPRARLTPVPRGHVRCQAPDNGQRGHVRRAGTRPRCGDPRRGDGHVRCQVPPCPNRTGGSVVLVAGCCGAVSRPPASRGRLRAEG